MNICDNFAGQHNNIDTKKVKKNSTKIYKLANETINVYWNSKGREVAHESLQLTCEKTWKFPF